MVNRLTKLNKVLMVKLTFFILYIITDIVKPKKIVNILDFASQKSLNSATLNKISVRKIKFCDL